MNTLKIPSTNMINLACLLILVLFGTTVRADCYSHDGVPALQSKYYTGPELVSCGNHTNNCCLQNEKCGTNLLCTSSIGTARQYCAVASWAGCSTACPGGQAAGVSLKECPTPNVYCCGNCDCSVSPLYFIDPYTGELSDASRKASSDLPTWWKVDSAAILAGTSSAIASSSPSSVAISTRSSDKISSSSATLLSSATSTSSTATSTSSSTATSAANTTTAVQPPASDGLSPGASAGIGIGSAAAAIGVAVLVWLFFRERKKRRLYQAQAAQGQNPQPIFGGGHHTYDSVNQAQAPPQYKPYHGQVRQEMEAVERHEMR